MDAAFASASTAAVPVRDLERVVTLPRRVPVDCQRDVQRRYAPETQALIEFMTEKFARPRKLPCACRARRVTVRGGALDIEQDGKTVTTTVDEFSKENAYDPETCRLVRSCGKNGYSVDLPGFGYACIKSFNPVQAWALLEMRKADGALGFCAVGSGKSILGILAPLAVENCKLAVLLGEPSQRLHYRMFYLRLREHFHVPSIIFDRSDVGGYIVPGMPVIHFRPYSLLSNPKSTAMLEELRPDTIIADECHRVSRRGNSNSQRLLRYMREHNAENVRLCAWSGTLTKKSICDVSHLSAFALGLGSPYPIRDDEAEAWSRVVDPSPLPDRTSSTARAMKRAFGRAGADRIFETGFTDGGIREGLQKRINETPGVISTKGSSASAAIYMHERKIEKIPEIVKKALAGVRQDAVRPDGEELVEAFEVARCAREVASGFHYFWFYPEYAAAKMDEKRAKVVAKIEAWFAARKAYGKDLRAKLLHPEVHLDSPKLCANAAERAWRVPAYDGDLPIWKCATWPEWRDIKDTVLHESRTAWLDDYLAQDAVAWGREHRGIIWYQNNAFGRRVAEILGVPCHGGGPGAEAAIMAEDGSRSIVASVKAHGAGRDGLQLKFSEQLIAEIPSSNAIFEQLLGRLCRDGQPEDAVQTWLPLHVSENKDALRAAMREAEFVEQVTGNLQLLLMADRSFDL